MPTDRLSRRLAVLALTLLPLVAGCESLFGEEEEPPLPGERVSVMALEREIAPDPTARTEDIVLPTARRNADWPQPGGDADHAMQHLALSADPSEAWRIDAGSGASDGQPRLPPLIAAGGRIYVMDAEHVVRAFSASGGERVWTEDLADDEDDDVITGGIAIEAGRLFATTGHSAAFALDAASGAEVWRRRIGTPIHASPTAHDGRVFFVSVTNRLFAISSVDGSELWPPYQAIEETARLLGGPSPAIAEGVVVAPFTSGEIVAAQVETGNVAWQDSLSSRRRTDELAALSQIRARPVIDNGRVYVINFGGLFVAFDLRTGRRLWEQEIPGLSTPWVAGDFLYVVSSEGDVVCLSAIDGRIYWVTTLPRFEDEEDLEDPIVWSGPVVAGEQVFVVGSNGEMRRLSPYDGRELETIEIGDEISLAPIVADGTLYVLRQDATLIAYR